MLRVIHRGFWLVTLVSGLLVIGPDRESVRADTPSAHAIEADRRRADEKEMLARARAEAEERRLEQERQRAQIEYTPYPPHADTTRASDQAVIDSRVAADRAREVEVNEARHRAERDAVNRSGDPQSHADQERRAALIAEREAEGRRIAVKLRQAETERADRDQRRADQNREPMTTGSPHRSPNQTPPEPAGRHGYGEEPDQGYASAVGPTRVTVLLLMEPGNRGIRRTDKTADPVLCSDDGCWISNGSAEPADLLRKRKALGFVRTWGGERAGACSHLLGCVFRNVELGVLPAVLQPVDMRLVRHDRREPKRIDAASHCRIESRSIQCQTGYQGADYVMWVIPEAVATEAGPARLERALEDGLPVRARLSSVPTVTHSVASTTPQSQ